MLDGSEERERRLTFNRTKNPTAAKFHGYGEEVFRSNSRQPGDRWVGVTTKPARLSRLDRSGACGKGNEGWKGWTVSMES